MKIKKIFLLLTALLTGSNAITSDACTNLIVGKNASTDGSVIVTYNADNFRLYGFLRRYPQPNIPKGPNVTFMTATPITIGDKLMKRQKHIV